MQACKLGFVALLYLPFCVCIDSQHALRVTPPSPPLDKGTTLTVLRRPAPGSRVMLTAAVAPPPLSKRQRLTVLVVGMALCNDVLLLLMLVPMLPALLPASAALSPFGLACLFSAKDLMQLLFAPLAGAFTLRAGAQNSLTASLLALSAATVAFAEARSFGALLLARALQGIASAALMSGGLTLVAQTHTASQRSAAIATAQSGLGVGATLGPVLGGLLLDGIGKRATFYLAAALVALNGAAALTLAITSPAPLVPSSAAERRGAREPPLRQLLSLVRHRDIAVVAMGILAQFAAGGCFDALFGVHLADAFGIGPRGASLRFALEPLTYLITLAILTPRMAHANKAHYSAFGLGLTALSLPALTAGSRIESVTVATVLHGIGYGFKDAACHGLLAQIVERSGVGSFAMAFSLADVADSLGYVIGPPLGSALCAALGKTGGLSVLALMIAALLPAMVAVEG